MELLVWGTGEFAQLVKLHIDYINAALGKEEYAIEAYIDNDRSKAGQVFCGKQIKTPDELQENHLPIVIGVYEDREIRTQIKEKIGGEFYSFFDFVYRDILLEKNQSLFCKDKMLCEKIQMQREWAAYLSDAVNGSRLETDRQEDIAGILFSLYSKDLRQAEQAQKKINLHKKKRERRNVKTVAVYYTRYTNGGVERVISYHLKMFQENGYDVVFFVDEINEEDDYNLPDGVHRVLLDGKKEGNMYLWMRQIYQMLDEYGVDALISHQSYWEGNYYLNLIARQLDFMFIIAVHNIFRSFAFKNINFYVGLYRNADKVVCLSEADRKFWGALGADCVYIPNPVCEATYKNEDKPNRVFKQVLWVGRIEDKQKNFSDVIDVAVEVRKHIPDIVFHVVGRFESDAFQTEILNRVYLHDLQDTIHFHGYAKDPSEYFKSADCLILTSSYEGFPMVLTEAMAAGLPVITYAMPYLEVLKMHKGYVEVPQRDVRKMAEAIADLADNPEWRQKLAAESREAISCFQKINLIERWKALFTGQNTGNVQDADEDYINIIRLAIEELTGERITEIRCFFRKM